MRAIINDLNLRKNEANNFIDYVDRLDKLEAPQKEIHLNLFPNIDIISVKTSIKASVILLLYNTVESTITKCLESIHTAIVQDNLNYSDLSIELKKIILTYYENAIVKSNDITKTIEFKLNQLEFIENRSKYNLTFKKLSQNYQMFSGNLDSKQIVAILSRYGIALERKCSELKTVKESRNKLAHGELSFEEVGRDLSIQQIQEIKDKVFEYMDIIVSTIQNYIEQKGYRNVLEHDDETVE